ncbi:MAG: hypothetical protein IT193_05325 [Propionibacteriaceae bacterium]|nr:hypothetical protein [Propionibacteriaceae bacterium]
MTGILVVLALIVFLMLALQPAHRRATTQWRPGIDTRNDRDLARLHDDLRASAQRGPDPAAPSGVAHLAAPRTAATDHRLVTRSAA